jgi:hypothetical protein
LVLPVSLVIWINGAEHSGYVDVHLGTQVMHSWVILWNRPW